MPATTLVTEAFNLDEGQSLSALSETLSFLTRSYDRDDIEMMIAATSPDNPDLRRLLSKYPRVAVVDCRGLGYDEAKMKVAGLVRGEIIAFLDGDCVPVATDWLARLTAPVRAGTTPCAGGRTRYAGGLMARICSILDFGFLYDVADGAALGCYVSNNFAIRREHLLRYPIPDSALRCNCYCHAQKMLQRGTPFLLVADAVVCHELPSFFKERWRRGADFVEETVANPALAPARSHPSRLVSAYRIYRDNLRLDRERLRAAKTVLGLSSFDEIVAFLAFPVFRLVDLTATFVALREPRLVVEAPAADTRAPGATADR